MSRDAEAPLVEPTLRMDSQGSIQDANEAALALLGLSVDDLRALPAGALSAEPADPEEQAALRAQWAAAGSHALAGLTTIKRGDGSRVRVAFAIALQSDGSFIATLNEAPGSLAAKSRIYTVGDVLARWRAADRQLQRLPTDSADYDEVREEVEDLRAQYQRIFQAHQQAS